MDTIDPVGASTEDACRAIERRLWPRRPNAHDELDLIFGDQTLTARVLNASPGGMGLQVDDVAQLRAGDRVALAASGDSISAVVRFVTVTAEGGYRLGVEWAD
jgi:hypothetical protein